ncbi:hypothetical protein [Methanobacterium formicicum]|uniref:hypothetical protein n=1 Tax=Methanobacterium formicicum TaxID=2162 RepID=UPI00249250DD|nr:hypothetical protein [Methanobacterium formicicum]
MGLINNRNMTITLSTFTGNPADMFGGFISNRNNLTVHFFRLMGKHPYGHLQ